MVCECCSSEMVKMGQGPYVALTCTNTECERLGSARYGEYKPQTRG